MTAEVPVLSAAHQVLATCPERALLAVHGGPQPGRMTVRELHERAQAVSDRLRAAGVGTGDRVALLFTPEQWLLFLPAWLGVLRNGSVAVPLSPRFSAAEVQRVLRDCAPSAVMGNLTGQDFGGCLTVSAGELGTLRTGSVHPPQQLPATALATVLYTSGTTGLTKGVACPHGSLVSASFPRPTRSLHAFPLDSSAGQNVTVRTLLGSPTHVAAGFSPRTFTQVMEAERIEWVGTSPSMAGLLLRNGRLAERDLSALRTFLLAGAPSPPRLLAQLRAALPPTAQVVNHYTLTEAGAMFLAQPYDPARPTAIGRVDGPTQVCIRTGDGAVAPVGTTGEICLRAGFPTVRRFYLSDPEATQAVFHPDGWLRTGDLGYVDGEGYVHLVDRKKDLIVRGGANISCLEVEAVLAMHPSVVEVAVFGAPHEALGEIVAAAVVATGELTLADLRALARDHGLSEDKLPERLFLTDELPRTATGKVLKRVLAERLASVEGGA